jgi:hypothetical protein
MANFLKILVGETALKDPFPIILNYDVIENIKLKDPDAVEAVSGKILISLDIRDGEGNTDLNATKIALQTIFDAIQTLPGGKVVDVNFPKNIECSNFSKSIIG